MAKQRPGKKSDPRQERIERGRQLLAAWGVHEGTLPEGTPPEEVFRTLEPLAGKDPTCDLIIAEWMGRLPLQQAADRLAAWEDAARDKELKRELRRSLFKLEQKGFRVARKAEPAAPFTLGGPASEPEGFLGPVDGEGSRMASILRPARGGVTALLTVINDQDGMIFVDAVSAKRQAFMETLSGSSGSGPVARVPWEYADALMHAAFRIAAPRPGNMRSDYLLSRAEITKSEPAPVPACPAREMVSVDPSAEGKILDKSAELFKEREYRSWFLPDNIARVHLQRLANAAGSGLVLSKEASRERVMGIMDEALDELLAGPLRLAYARRLQEMSYLFHLQGRAEPARSSLAVALALENPEGRRMKEISFLRGLVFRAFAPYLMTKDARTEQGEPKNETAEGSSVILDPAKAALRTPGPDEESGDADGAPPLIITP